MSEIISHTENPIAFRERDFVVDSMRVADGVHSFAPLPRDLVLPGHEAVVPRYEGPTTVQRQVEMGGQVVSAVIIGTELERIERSGYFSA